MNLTHKYADSLDILNESTFDNGDIVFSKEDSSIYMGGVTEEGTSSLDLYARLTEWNDIVDNTPVIGIALTGEFDTSGAKLAWIDKNFNDVTGLDKDYFDSNPVFKFETVTDSGNKMVRVPLCYWWKGIIPKGPHQGNWGMLVSTKAKTINGTTMKPNYVAFMNTDGQLQNSFAIGAYRGKLSGSKFVSTADGNPTGNYTFEETKNYCKANGGTYSLLTFQAWHDICSRAVIERKSFMLTGTDAARKTLNAVTGYRGIVDAFYSYGESGSIPYAEWMDGVQSKQLTASTDLRVIQTFSNDGSRTYVDAYTTTEGKDYNGYPTEFLSNEYMDNLLFGKPETVTSTAPADGVNVIIPDCQYFSGSSEYPYLGSMLLNSSDPNHGPFRCYLRNSPTNKNLLISGRLAAFL